MKQYIAVDEEEGEYLIGSLQEIEKKLEDLEWRFGLFKIYELGKQIKVKLVEE